MKKHFALVMMLIFAFCLGLAGCGGKQQGTESQPAGSQQAAKEESISDLLAKGKNIEGMSYDFILTAKENVISGKQWLQGKNMKMETVVQGQKMITIVDGDNNAFYNYLPDQKMAIKISAGQLQKVDTPNDYTGDLQADPGKVKIVGTEVYDGAKCKVVEVASGQEQMKMWVREDCGVPVKVEAAGPDGVKSVMEFKNLKLGPQEPGTFKLPDGVQVTDMGEMLKNIPGVQ